MITRYFQHDAEDATRIAAVTAGHEDDIYSAGFARADEIDAADLPENFASWRQYTAFAKGDAIVEVLSEHGD